MVVEHRRKNRAHVHTCDTSFVEVVPMYAASVCRPTIFTPDGQKCTSRLVLEPKHEDGSWNRNKHQPRTSKQNRLESINDDTPTKTKTSVARGQLTCALSDADLSHAGRGAHREDVILQEFKDGVVGCAGNEMSRVPKKAMRVQCQLANPPPCRGSRLVNCGK